MSVGPFWLQVAILKLHSLRCTTGIKAILRWKMVTQEENSGVPTVIQWIKNPLLSLQGCRFDPWPCSVG